MNEESSLLGRGHALGPALVPVLYEVTGGRLRDIRWFQTDWQRGGAATGYGTFTDDEGADRAVVVKVPVRPGEIRWLLRMNGAAGEAGVGPMVYAHGLELGSYDLAWIVMERFEGKPLALNLTSEAWDAFADVAARFYARASAHEVDEGPRIEDWHELLARAREQVKLNVVEHTQRWNKAIKGLQKSLDDVVARWRARPCDAWCHGDLHPANAMRRAGESGVAHLIDMAEVHAGHWVEDAVYVERLFWGRREKLLRESPVKRIARARKRVGLENGESYGELATIRRALMAASAPAFLSSEGGPSHLRGALDVLEKAMKSLA
ncbi:MAG: aminoglycoside phosphotransferase family protein [Phycisphaerales bacterium]|nr:aminoglycoside phosphotransferase family protein [Phycisphaerales bacterium]